MAEQTLIGRERQMAQLQGFLERALAGQGQVCFVVGEAGTGKTTLVSAFARRVQETHRDLLVTIGSCNDQTGVGDAYLPFREILAMLTGDVQSSLARGVVTKKNATRLQKALHLSIRTLIEVGPDLVGVFVPAAGLLLRLGSVVVEKTGWLMDKLGDLAEEKAETSKELKQGHLFEQYTQVLRAIAENQPLLLILDDLHWADASSLGLLFHLGRNIEDDPILIVGTYRPDEVALGRAGERHPLEKVQAELKRYQGDIEVDLDQAVAEEGLSFVRFLLDSEPHCLGTDFLQALYQQTGGHPLFTIELLRAMQERGDLVQDTRGRWIPRAKLNWNDLPARVEGVIEERIARLATAQQETLQVASVEGDDFTAEVVAQTQDVELRTTIRWLSRELDRRHRLVQAQGVRHLDAQRLSLYRFRHNLFQEYLYHGLDLVERADLHERVGTALESLYAGQEEQIVVQLAWHFMAADLYQKAFPYLVQAGEQAAARYANEEAVAYFRRALGLLPALKKVRATPAAEVVTRLHFVLGRVLNLLGKYDQALDHLKAAFSLDPSPAAAPWRARVCYAIGRIYERQVGADNLAQALDWVRRGLDLLPPTPTAEAALLHTLSGIVHLRQGDFDRADEHGRSALALAEAAGSRPGIEAAHRMLSLSAHAQGRLDQAVQHCQAAIAICEELGDPFYLGKNYANLGVYTFEHDDWEGARKAYLRAIELFGRLGDRFGAARACFNLGDLHCHQGNLQPGLDYARRGLRLCQKINARPGIITAHAVLATLHWRQGNLNQARAHLLTARELVGTATVFKSMVGRWLAQVYVQAGDMDQAEAEIAALLAEEGGIMDNDYEPVQCLHAQVLAARGQLAEAVAVLEASLERLAQKRSRYQAACAHLVLAGLLARMAGRAAEARAHAEWARAVFAHLGARLDLAEAEAVLETLPAA